MVSRSHVVALVAAAGSGERAGKGPPKQYRTIGGKSVLAHAIDRLAAHDAIGEVRAVIGAGQETDYRQAIADRALPLPVTGGATRRESVLAGLEAIATDSGADIVLVHDAARPFVPEAVIDRLLAAAGPGKGAIPALPVTDSLARIDGAGARREEFVRVQTPQAFGFEAILAAHRAWQGGEATDDAQIARAAGIEVALVEGDRALDKLTFAEDFPSATGLVRTGFGFDVHAFAPGDHVWLGGVRIPHDRSLAGHSDADTALHALTDAILGALGEGDIGSHFPPGDPEWKDCSSDRFLAHARELTRGRGLAIWHVDVTIVCEAPRIGPHREAMRGRIAGILEIPESAVSVKATTTERLGFTGRKEGIAAQAVATLGTERR